MKQTTCLRYHAQSWVESLSREVHISMVLV